MLNVQCTPVYLDVDKSNIFNYIFKKYNDNSLHDYKISKFLAQAIMSLGLTYKYSTYCNISICVLHMLRNSILTTH